MRAISAYGALEAMCANLSEDQRQAVSQEMSRAEGYVWGFQDATGRVEGDSLVSHDFMVAYGQHMAEFEARVRHSRKPIPEAWKEWTASGKIA